MRLRLNRHRAAAVLLFGTALATIVSQHDAALVQAASPVDDLKGTDSGSAVWAFQPLKVDALPSVRDDGWCRTAVDRFIFAKLLDKGLKPNPLADRRQLIRRAYFDLIGLPPDPAAVEQFINDPAPDAFDRVISQLLKNPHYGERWGRHWLDLARFAESHGYEQDYDRTNAYFYRDFVVAALNQDMPYDQFIKWQIAGDEFAPNDPMALMATGFLAAGTHATQITANQAEKERYDELDDMVRTIGTSMLGLTLGCARCHDHKFDPVATSEYYGLISTFSTTVRSDYDLDLDPAWYQTAKAKYDAEHNPLEESLNRIEREQLPDRLRAYLREHPDCARQFEWTQVDRSELKSDGGVTFTELPDGSRLAGGANPDQATYTFELHTKLRELRGIRLEALADPSLPKNGPGRAPNGNFGLSDIRVSVAPIADSGATAAAQTQPTVPAASMTTSVKIVAARSTFDQNGLPVSNAIDDKKDSCWAVDPQFGKDHAAVFEFESPVGFDGGTKITVTMEFKCNKQHAIGRPRISVTTAEHASVAGGAMPEAARAVLALLAANPTADLNAKQIGDLVGWYRWLDAEWVAQHDKVVQHASNAPKPKIAKVLISSEGVPAVRLHTQGLDFYDPTYQLKRGDPNQKGEVATQGFLHALVRSPEQEKRWHEPAPPGCRTSYRRRALANWLTDSDCGAGQLLARVIVNRLWYYHLGRGIVATPSDFGKQGERPSHPELLDWLANELITHEWRLSHIHKLIMTSAVYMQSSASDDVRALADRDNSLFWRWPVRRLDAEIIRDAMLAVGGSLDESMGGPGSLDPKQRRRSIYFFVKRSQLVPMMTLFDGPDTLQDLPCRVSTTIAPQALMLLNNATVRDHATGLAHRIQVVARAPGDAVRAGFLTALGRTPSSDELRDAVAFIEAQTNAYANQPGVQADELALVDFCQALLCLNEFVYVE